MSSARRIAALSLPLFVAACSSRGDSGGDRFAPDAGTGADMSAPEAGVGDDGGHDAGPGFDAGPTPDDTIVYAHSSDTLYAFDPRTNTVTSIGYFHLHDGAMAAVMTDLAVTRANELYTCSANALFRVDPLTAESTFLTALDVPFGETLNGMTFVPVGVLDPANEVLVGATSGGAYYRIDTTTGAFTLAGHYGGGFGSSGDIVSVAGAGPGGAVGTFATAIPPLAGNDHLVLLDAATGATTDLGDIGFPQVYGLGYWRSKLYGFTSSGRLIEIDIHTGLGRLVSASTGASEFFGAGVTTIAPTLI